MIAPPDIVAKFRTFAPGSFTGQADGKSYVVSVSTFSNARAVKLVADERGGSDYISLNIYDLSTGPRLYPCEMPAQKVIRFIRSLVPDVRTDSAP